MPFAKNDWVWILYPNRCQLGLVLAVREHTVVLRTLDGTATRLQPARESFSKRMLLKAELSEEQRYRLPCGKRPLNLGRAKQIVATNRIFTDNPNRKERRVYYCRRCKAFHTTGQFKLPVELLKRLDAYPYMPEGLEDYADGRARRRVWRWLNSAIGINVSYKLYERSLIEYGNNSKKEAVYRIVLDPLGYIHYLFLYLYKRRKEKEGLSKPTSLGLIPKNCLKSLLNADTSQNPKL